MFEIGHLILLYLAVDVAAAFPCGQSEGCDPNVTSPEGDPEDAVEDIVDPAYQFRL